MEPRWINDSPLTGDGARSELEPDLRVGPLAHTRLRENRIFTGKFSCEHQMFVDAQRAQVPNTPSFQSTSSSLPGRVFSALTQKKTVVIIHKFQVRKHTGSFDSRLVWTEETRFYSYTGQKLFLGPPWTKWLPLA